MKIALLFVLVATFLALGYGAPAVPDNTPAEAAEAVGEADDTSTKSKRNLIALGYGYTPYAYAAPYAYAPAYTYPTAYASYHPYAAYNYGYIYG